MRLFAARVAMLCVLGLATLGASGGGGDFARFLDRMRAAAGPVWRTHFVSISRVSYSGSQTVVATDSYGLPFILRRCAGELCEGTYFDGRRLFEMNANGTALPQRVDPEPYLRSLRTIASLAFLAPAYASNGSHVDDGGMTTIAGKRYRTMFVVDPDAIPMRVFVDPQTALIRYARDINGDDIFEYKEYRKVDGFTVPFSVLHNGDVLERYDDRTPVSSAFRPPHGPLPLFKGAPAKISTDPAHAIPIFPCTLGGVAVRCLLDSGNSGLSMSSELAARLDAPVVGNYTVRGLGGYSTQVVRAGQLQIANATYPEAYYVVLNEISRFGYDVVLGADILSTTSLELDGSTHTIQLGARPPTSAINVPLSFENFVPVVEISLGTVKTKLAVDTGDESNINLAYDFYSKHQDLFAITESRLVGGVGGSSVEMIGNIPQVTIGAYVTGTQQIGTTKTLQGTAFGHLGAAFLKQFKVQLDYAASQLHLTPLQ